MLTSNRNAFTLIELLVVIAVIAILAAVLFPAFIVAKKAGQAKACMGNVKQLGMASVMYADDHSGVLVPAVAREYVSNQSGGFKERRYWRQLLFRYIKSTGAYVCPAMPKEAAAWGPVPEQDVYGTYGINQAVSSNDSDWQGRYIHSMSQYRRPSGIILLTEVRHGIWTTGAALLYDFNLPVYAPTFHNGMLNVAFIDGHCRTMYMYNTIGDSPGEWMWHDPSVNPNCGSVSDIAASQKYFKSKWPKNYPPFGGA